MMRRLGFLSVVVVLLGALGYLASPFYAAWALREAIKSGDTATIKNMVVWDQVRDTLRTSIATQQKLLPEANELGEKVSPTMWQRLKTAFGSSMLDRFIDSYVTPEGLPQLFKYRKTWNVSVKREVDEDTLPFAERAKYFYRRIARAEFQSPTRLEIEMMDKATPDRRYITVMELHGFEWKLSGLRVAMAPGS
jgi:hypothetical protein